MQLGMIGLGRMGNGMTERLREHDHDVRTYDPQVESRTAAFGQRLITIASTPEASPDLRRDGAPSRNAWR